MLIVASNNSVAMSGDNIIDIRTFFSTPTDKSVQEET